MSSFACLLFQRSLVGLFSSCALLGVLPLAADAATYYVAPDGDDTNAGSMNQPLATIQSAIDKVAPGDTVLIRGGVYPLSKGLWIGDNRSGTSSNWVTIKAYEGTNGPELVRLTGSPEHCFVIGGQYIEARGLTCDNAVGIGFLLWRAQHIRVINNTVANVGATGISMSSELDRRASDVLVEGNTVYLTNLSNKDSRGLNTGLVWGQGISSFGDRVTIRNNKVFQNYGEGIGVGGTGNQAISNTIYDNFSVNLYLDTAKDTIFERNLVFNTGDSRFFRTLDSGKTWNASNGIQVAREGCCNTKVPLENSIIRNNLVANTRDSFYYGSYILGGGMQNMRIVNNTFINAERNALYVDADAHTGTVIANNIFANTKGRASVFMPSQVGLTFLNNLWHGVSSDSVVGNNDIKADPLLANSEGTQAIDLIVEPNSPAIGKATSTDAPTNDFFGSPRPINGNPEIGAFDILPQLRSLRH
jgi:Right handed beta helix region